MLQWSWSVTARAPHDTDLTLKKLRPSIRRDDDGTIVADAEQTTEQRTRVEVTAGVMQRGSSWVDENKGYVAVLGAALIAVLLWLLRSIADVREREKRPFPSLRSAGTSDSGRAPEPAARS